MFVIQLLNGDEISETKGDTIDVNPNTGVVTVSRSNGFESTSTYYSPSAWHSVQQRLQRSVVPATPAPLLTGILQ